MTEQRRAILKFHRGCLTIYVHTNVRPWLVNVQWRRRQWWLLDFGQGLAK